MEAEQHDGDGSSDRQRLLALIRLAEFLLDEHEADLARYNGQRSTPVTIQGER